MTEQSVDEEKIADLAEVYGMLKKDAKDMLQDLLDGVSLWKASARNLFGFALVALALVPLFGWGASTNQGFLSQGLGLIGIFLFGLALVTTLTGLRYRQKYLVLKRKYSELYETAKKLS